MLFRSVFGAGLGVEEDLLPLGDHADDKTRAAMTDEALDLIIRWCRGETVEHHGEHYRSDGTQIAAGSVQEPGMPVWIGGWSRPALRRAARWDGWIVSAIDEHQSVWFGPDRLADSVAYLQHQGAGNGFDVAVNGTTPAGGSTLPAEYAEAGATWWFESLFGLRGSHDQLRERVAAGPPR